MLSVALQATLTLRSCFPNFPSASYLIMYVKQKQATQDEEDEENKTIAIFKKIEAYLLLLCRMKYTKQLLKLRQKQQQQQQLFFFFNRGVCQQASPSLPSRNSSFCPRPSYHLAKLRETVIRTGTAALRDTIIIVCFQNSYLLAARSCDFL